MKHYGDVSKIEGSQVEPVDIITFGSPCQDLSVAGKRAGIQDGERSNLFFEAVRIIKEMREATNGEYPKYAVWENVPGAFSSNKGHDFHAVLEALCSVCDSAVSIPKPYDAKRTKLVWNKAGEIVGDNYSIAWRTLDAQYWGVPQRRKRIYLVADFGSQRAGEILFKPDSLRGDMSQGNETGQGAAAHAVGSVDGSVGVECLGFDMYNQSSTGDKTRTLKTPAGGDDLPVIVLKERAGCDGGGKGALWSDKAFTLATNQDMSVIAPQANGIDRTIPINDKATRFKGGGDTRKNDGAGNGLGIGKENDPSPTVTAADRHAVCYDARGNGDGETVLFEPRSPDGEPRIYDDICPTLNTAQGGQRQPCVVQNTLCFNEAQITSPTNGNNPQWNEPCHTISATDNRAPTVIINKPPHKYIIRRLTPTECARLQGFPDWWGRLAPYNPNDADFWEDVRKTHAEINGKSYKPVKDIKKWYDKLHTDSAEYKAYGNGLALPCAEYVIRGIAEQGANTLGSLFDGIGGFPLAGVLNGIKPVWASEVEPYAIAVTKSIFAASAAERKEK